MMEMDAPLDQSLSSQKSQVGETVSIPVDLVMDILKRLPARDVLRSRSVCKEWNFLLTTPKFISLHYNHSLHMRHENAAHSVSFIFLRIVPSRPGFQIIHCSRYGPNPVSIVLTFLTLEQTTTQLVAKVNREEDFIATFSSLFFPSCPTQSDLDDLQMICPFDGLVCFGCAESVIMYNPATRESQVLPLDHQLSNFNYLKNDHYILGVWFESTVKQHYKVFRMNSGKRSCKIHIYDSTVDSWRVSKSVAGTASYRSGLLLNGVVYFETKASGVHVIVTFDAKLEIFGCIEARPSLTRPIFSSLLPFHGNLACVDENFNINDYATIKFDLWVMIEYGVQKSWTHKFCVPFDFSIFESYYGSPLAIWKNRDDEDEFLIKIQGDIVSVNLNTKKKTNLKLPCISYSEIKIIPYNVESLLYFVNMQM